MNCTLRSIIFSAILSAAALPAAAEIVVIINPKNPVANMTQEQLAQYYLGVSNSFVPLDQPEGSPIRVDFYKKITDKEPSQVRAIWAKLVFTGKGRMPKEHPTSNEVKKAVGDNVNAIGYVERSAADASVKILMTIP